MNDPGFGLAGKVFQQTRGFLHKKRYQMQMFLFSPPFALGKGSRLISGKTNLGVRPIFIFA